MSTRQKARLLSRSSQSRDSSKLPAKWLFIVIIHEIYYCLNRDDKPKMYTNIGYNAMVKKSAERKKGNDDC